MLFSRVLISIWSKSVIFTSQKWKGKPSFLHSNAGLHPYFITTVLLLTGSQETQPSPSRRRYLAGHRSFTPSTEIQTWRRFVVYQGWTEPRLLQVGRRWRLDTVYGSGLHTQVVIMLITLHYPSDGSYTPTNRLSPKISPANRLSPKTSPNNQLSPKISPNNQLSPKISPTNQLPPKISPTNQLSPKISPTNQLSSNRCTMYIFDELCSI